MPTTMTDPQTALDALRLEISALPPEYQVLARYIDALHAQQTAQIADIKAAFDAGKGALSVLKFLASIGAAMAVIYGAFHGVRS